MHINDKDISEYNAKLLNRQILPSEMSINSYWPDGSTSPFIDKNVKYKYKTLNLGIEFKGNPSEIELHKSKLISDISVSEIEFKALNNYYSGHVTSISVTNKVIGYETINIAMLVVEHSKETVINFNRQSFTTIQLTSTATTPCILEVKPSIDLVSATITGFGEDITLSNLTTGQTIIIDGEKGTVTENGQNKWLDYDSWGFPKLDPGVNNIAVDRVTLDITIRYKARWL